jgi:hypothetical protein
MDARRARAGCPAEAFDATQEDRPLRVGTSESVE